MSTQLSAVLPSDRVRITMDPATAPFWEAARDRRLVAPRCHSCGRFRLPPTPFCPACQSRDVDWVELAGVAEVYSFAVVHGFPGLPDILLVPAVVDLPDAPGARLVSNILGVRPEEVAIGMRLSVDFTTISDGWLLPVFVPHAKESDRDE